MNLERRAELYQTIVKRRKFRRIELRPDAALITWPDREMLSLPLGEFFDACAGLTEGEEKELKKLQEAAKKGK